MTNFNSFPATYEFNLEKVAPLKSKNIRYNNQLFMIKSFWKAILIRSRLKNKDNKEENSKKICVNTSVSPFLTEKPKTSNNIIFTENNKSVKEDGKIYENFNLFH